MVPGEKHFVISFFGIGWTVFSLLKKKKEKLPDSFALEKLWSFITAACNYIITLVSKWHYAFKMYQLSAFQK